MNEIYNLINKKIISYHIRIIIILKKIFQEKKIYAPGWARTTSLPVNSRTR